MDAMAKLILALLLLFLAACVLGLWYSKKIIDENPFLDRHLLERGMEKPVIWLYYDTSDVNSRNWYDFGARSSRALNMPFLNLCYETIVAQNQGQYRIEVITGLTGVAQLLGLEAMPVRLRNAIASVNEAEINWIRSAILAKFGGLWLNPYSVCLRPFGKLPEDRIVFYGTDLDESYAGKEGTAVPGFRCVWSPAPSLGLFSEWEQICKQRLDAQAGGQQIRGDAKWDWISLSSKYPNVQVDYAAEGGRKQAGKRIELEDLLAAGTEGKLPFPVPTYTVYIPLLWPELRDREIFGWFLRMSEDQILTADLAIRYLLEKGLVAPPLPTSVNLKETTVVVAVS